MGPTRKVTPSSSDARLDDDYGLGSYTRTVENFTTANLLDEQLFNLISCIIISIACSYGGGNHEDTLSVEQVVNARFWITVGEAFTVLAPMFGRVSVALLVLSILGPTRTYSRITLWTIIAIQVIENAMIVIELWAQCHDHPEALWDVRIAAHYFDYCIPLTFQTVLAYLSSGISIHNVQNQPFTDMTKLSTV